MTDKIKPIPLGIQLDAYRSDVSGCGGGRTCRNQPTDDAHPCPFQEDVNNDPSDHCHCCAECQSECAMDI